MRWITLLAAIVCFAPVASFAADASPAEANEAAAEEPQLEGVVVERKNGGFLAFTMSGPSLIVRFYDEKKKPVAPDVERGFVRFQYPNRTPERRPLIRGDDGMSLTHGQPLRPPHVFKAFVSLSHGDDDASVESYVVDYP